MGRNRGTQHVLGRVGVIDDFAGSAAPDGALFCFGQAISRTTYMALFAIIGTTFGAGDGTTTFNIPDLRGRVLAGPDNMGGTAANRLTSIGSGVDGTAIGNAGGTETRTLTTAQLPAHNHGVTDAGHTHTLTDPGHVHTLTDPGHTHSHNANAEGSQGSSGTGGATIFALWQAATVNSATTGISMASKTTGITQASATTGITTQNAGSGNAVPIVQPVMVINKIIWY
jgi:microcystin-dependent protein